MTAARSAGGAVNELPERQRFAVTLKYVGDLDHHGVAAQFHVRHSIAFGVGLSMFHSLVSHTFPVLPPSGATGSGVAPE